MLRLLLLPLILLLALSCAWPETSVPIAELLDAPTMLNRNDRTFLPYACLGRDFMPGGNSPDGSGLGVYVQVWCEDSLPTNVDLTADRAWVIYRSARAVWETDVKYAPGWNPHGFLRAIAVADGPKWDIGLLCDVVVRLVDTNGGTWFLRTTDVEIKKHY